MLNLLFRNGSLLSTISWDFDLALFAVQNVPMCYLYLPESVLSNNLNKKLLLASLFHQQLIAGDDTTIDLLLKGSPPLINKVVWDRDLALQAVLKTPKLYLYLPANLTRGDHELASSFHNLLVSGDASIINLLLSGSPPLINRVVWNRELALKAVQATPKLYFHLPPTLTKDDKEMASCSIHRQLAAGDKAIIDLLLSGSPPLIENVYWDRDLALQAVHKTPKLYLYLPPALTKNDKEMASSIHRQLAAGDKAIIDLLVSGSPPLIEKVYWDRDLALQAVCKTPKLYLYLPLTLIRNDKEMASSFNKALVSGDKTIIHLLLKGPPSLLHKVDWNRNLALEAVRVTPKLYRRLPASLKKDDTELAIATLVSPKADIDDVKSSWNGLLTNPVALHHLFSQGGKKLVRIVVMGNIQIAWNEDLVDLARTLWPTCRHFLPARYRDDSVGEHGVVTSLFHLKNGDSNVEAAVDAAVFAAPGFFTNRDAVEELFLTAKCDDVISYVVKRASSIIPWDRELIAMATERFPVGDFYCEDNLTDIEVENIYKWDCDCKYHLPLGMILSFVVKKAAAEDDWPPFLNKCRCTLERSDSMMKEALEFVVPMMRNIEDLSSEMASWLVGMVPRIKKDYFQNRVAFETWLMCISAADDNGPMQGLKGNDETSIGLKREIAEFLGACGNTKRTTIKVDAARLVYCLLTLPSELYDEIDPADYHGDARGEETFYCVDCCKELVRLKKIYGTMKTWRRTRTAMRTSDDES